MNRTEWTLTRREVLARTLAVGPVLGAGGEARLAMEAYIFQQYAQRQGKKLGDVLPEVIPMAKAAGFQAIELNREFLSPDLRSGTLSLIASVGLRMPSVYSGGPMHDSKLAERSVAEALDVARACQPFGCRAVVFNPSPKGENIQKTDDELRVQAEALNRMGKLFEENQFQLRIHHHTPEMLANAREWRHILENTNPQFVSICMDLDWVHQGGQDPLALLKEAGKRVREVHLRNSRYKLWLESLTDGDVDYRVIANYLKGAGMKPLLVVELAYRESTVVTRSLEEDLRQSRVYAERTFGITT